MKIKKNEPRHLIFANGDLWVSFQFYPGSTKIGVTESNIGGVPLLGPKNIKTLTDWLAEADRAIKATKKLRKQTDSDRLDNS